MLRGFVLAGTITYNIGTYGNYCITMYVGFFFQFCCLVRSEDTHEIKPPPKTACRKIVFHTMYCFLDSGVRWTEGVVRVTRLGGGCKSCFQVY